MHTEYQKYIPQKAIPFVQFLMNEHNFTLKIVEQRATKHGDFRQLVTGKFQITVNNNLNIHQFLLTLIHEIAHHVTFQKFGRVQSHGKEWKTVFQHLMMPFLHPDIYPKEILPLLANYLKNPKASSDADVNLSLALKGNIAETGKHFIFEILEGSLFIFKNEVYRRGSKRRTRFECVHVHSNKVYLFNLNVEVKITDETAILTNVKNKKEPERGKHFVYEIAEGSLFVFRNEVYKRGPIRRTRFECLHMRNKNVYLFNKNAQVKKYS